MSIRAEFQPNVDEFIDNLHSFATGDYLRDEEKEFWSAPFDASVLPQLKALLEGLLDQLDALPDDPGAEALAATVEHVVAKLAQFNRQHADAVLEPEEKQDLSELIYNASAATGANDEALAQLPDLEF